MADVRPILATHYDLDVVGPLNDVAAPPYDVIDTEQRKALLARSPYNAVAIDLPKPYGETGPTETGDDPYERAARTIEDWREAGALVTDPEPAIWAMTQDYTGPDGEARTRHGILARVRVEDFDDRPGPPPRAHPARPEEGPARPDPRDPPQPLGDLLPRHRRSLAARRPRDRGTAAVGRGDRRIGHRDQGLAGRRPRDPRRRPRAPRQRPAPDRRRPPPLRDRDRLPRRGRRRGRPQLHADGADRPRRPGPHRLPHPPHALRHRRRPRAPAGARQRAARAVRRHRGRRPRSSTPSARRGSASSASTTPTTAAASACASRTRRSPRSTSSSPASPRPTAGSTPRSSRRWC